ncbi:NADH-cytochrome b5 reductase 1 [Tilletiaria anomala UBC 951]|uniref:NADH-cytochrome b5 reductase n=1 Tax=Tilletiaria anomala (strain ATCC 24038 / CBS 436.72 / UBC 951) TaxID=1037660 RepID=A0A066VHZ1_TILAU|nr:NADH-cytochrome b5 reductase 1 [Tilletiaria anomala UBC 951]KDN39918.1 NADH-cytochrome b5 reductase 1 [Tilletiaria anomala UBC 951]
MIFEQLVLVSSILITFLSLLLALKLVARSTPAAAFFHPLKDLDEATNIMSDNTQILAFIIAIILALGAYQLILTRAKGKPILDPANWQKFKLLEKKQISNNTALYRFCLPHQDSYLGLPIGQHISVQADINGKKVARSYTPTSSDDDRGFFDLVIKSYPQGNISRVFGELKVGQSLEFKGPKGQMRYSPGLCRRIGMIAGGTGITPCLQIIRAAMKNPDDKTRIDLIYANVKESDILLREELDREAKAHPDKFTVHYFLNEPPAGWQGGTGFVTKEAIKEKLPAPADDIKILMCGPPPMLNAMKKHLEELEYKKPRTVSKLEDQVFCF